jgi:Na+-driven multidrug efflux pump
LPLAYSFSWIVGWGTNGIWLALSIGYMVAALMMTLRFQQGKWKLKEI